jgi:hypothetical protein
MCDAVCRAAQHNEGFKPMHYDTPQDFTYSAFTEVCQAITNKQLAVCLHHMADFEHNGETIEYVWTIEVRRANPDNSPNLEDFEYAEDDNFVSLDVYTDYAEAVGAYVRVLADSFEDMGI